MNTFTNDKLLTTIFKDPICAENAYILLKNKGYDKGDITVVMSEETRNKFFKDSDIPEDKLETKAVAGMRVGSTVGGTVGAIAAALAAAGTNLIIPGLGLVIAGPLAAAFAGAGAGSTVGGIVGALAGLGFTDENAKEYEAQIKAGNILVGVKISERDYSNLESELKNINLPV